jgi:hypothetical protein
MPFRFRKIFSLGKGLRLNISKRGISSSIGRPGATLNISKRGIRPTVGLPGTGLSFTPSQSNAQSTDSTTGAETSRPLINGIIFGISILLVCLISVCCIGVIFTDPGAITSTPTTETQNDINVIIVNTSSAAQTQTMIFAPPSSTPVIFDTPTMLPPVTFAPTWTPIPTQTPFVFVPQGIAPANATCSCNGDTLNCSNFNSHQAAQDCFNTCMAQSMGDIHKLDENNDGNACEGLQ